jgi:hypothetical protein
VPAPDATPGNDTSHGPQPRPGWSTRSRPLLGALPAALLVTVAVWEILAATRAGHDVPGQDAWERAAQAVREQHAPGDLIVFAPGWIDPVGRMHLGDRIPVDMAARMDDARFGTVWELSIRGASAPESRGREVAWSQDFAGLRVRKLVAEPAVVVTDFVAAFDRAQMEGQAVGNPRVVLAEVGFEPHRCVQVEPRPDQTVRVVYRDVALGSILVGHAGLADVFTRRDIRAPGRVEVLVNGARVAGAELGVDDGWVKFSAATTPGTGDVEFWATAAGESARKRLICFAAEARK